MNKFIHEAVFGGLSENDKYCKIKQGVLDNRFGPSMELCHVRENVFHSDLETYQYRT